MIIKKNGEQVGIVYLGEDGLANFKCDWRKITKGEMKKMFDLCATKSLDDLQTDKVLIDIQGAYPEVSPESEDLRDFPIPVMFVP